MSNDASKPPEPGAGTNKPAGPDGHPPPGSALRAVLAGLAVDIGGSTAIGLLLSAFYAAQLSNAGLSTADVQQALDSIPADSPVEITGTLLGACCSVAGGYVCARIARHAEFRSGGLMAFLSAFLGLLLGAPDTPDDLTLLLTLSTAACVLLGVKYGREYNGRARARAQAARAALQNRPPGPPRP